MWPAAVKQVAARLRSLYGVVAQQVQLIKHKEQAGVVVAGVDAVHLTGIVLGERTGARDAMGCASRRPDPAVEPSGGLCNGAALRLRRGPAGCHQLRQLSAVSGTEPDCGTLLTTEPVADHDQARSWPCQR